MAVEAHHLNLFTPQLIKNWDIINSAQNNASFYNPQMGFGIQMPALDNYYAACNSVVTDSVPETTVVPAATRKRAREFCFLGEDLSSQMQQQQLEIDQYIAQHVEKVRWELMERRKRQSRRLLEAVEQGIVKRLRAKEEEIQKIGKLNWVLEERVKSLSLENQIWHDLARTNEATANALRSNLEQVLAHVQFPPSQQATVAAKDAGSCCDSCGNENEPDSADSGDFAKSSRKCRNCNKAESCVLLLPCRHLCLCAACGSSLHTCPVCQSTKNASVHVNMS